MKLSKLLAHRRALLRQANLANLAYAYQTLSDLAERISRARLTGWVNLKQAAPDEERYLPTLRAIEGSQAVIEEHFSDEDVMEMADLIAFACEDDALDIDFQLEDMHESFIAPLRSELENAGVAIDSDVQSVEPRKP